MALRQFVLALAGAPTDGQVGALFGRCDDLVVEVDAVGGRAVVAFDRDAPTLLDAIVSAVRDLDVVGLVPAEAAADDDLVTLATIAERVGRPYEAVRAWSSAGAPATGFPAPVDWAVGESCYRWGEVAPWLRRHQRYEAPDLDPSIEAVNLGLRLRELAPRVDRIAALRSLLPG